MEQYRLELLDMIDYMAKQQNNSGNTNDISLPSENIMPLTGNRCVLCKGEPSFICTRCGDPYCSQICQKNDWRRHRFICFALPPLAPIGSLCSSNSPQTLVLPPDTNALVNSNLKTRVGIDEEVMSNSSNSKDQGSPVSTSKNSRAVIITGFRSSNRCNVRGAGEAETDEYVKVCEMVNREGAKMPKLSTSELPKHVVVKHNDIYKRAEVLVGMGTNKQKVRVLFMDHGYMRSYRRDELFAASDMLIQLPCYSRVVQLKNVRFHNFSNENCDFFKSFVGETCLAHYENDNMVELMSMKTLTSLNESIRSFQRNLPFAKETVAKLGITNGKEYLETESSAYVDKMKDLKRTLKTEPLASTKPALMTELESKMSALLSSVQQTATTKPVEESNKTQNKLQEATAKSTHPERKRQLNQPFPTTRLRTNAKGLDVFIVDDTNVSRGMIGVFDSCHINDLTKLFDYLNNFKDPEPYAPVNMEYVLVQHEDSWCRAKVVKIKGSPPNAEYKVILVEHAREAYVTFDNIRRYPDDFPVPCHTNTCVIEGFPSKLNEMQEKFVATHLATNRTLHIDKVKYVYESAFITCESLISKIKDPSLGYKL